MSIEYNENNINRAIESCTSRLEKYIYDYYAFDISDNHREKLYNQIEIEIVKIEALFQLLNKIKK